MQSDDCHWCDSEGVFTVSIDELGSLFRDVASMYIETGDTSGDDIASLLQEDWKIFSEKIEESPDDIMREMAIEILEAGLRPKDHVYYPNFSGNFRRVGEWLEDEWESKIISLLTNKKSIKKVKMEGEYPSVLEVAYEDLGKIYEKGYIFFRARIHNKRTRRDKFVPADLGAPPPEETPAARANRKGEPVLYLSSDTETALSEVRAWKGAAVAIAKMRTCRQLLIVNLLEFKFPESPFFEEDIRWKIQLAGLFQRFVDELSRPVIPHEQERLYLPSQHLCNLFKENGYDGVAFPSAMGKGDNVVLFDPLGAEPLEVTYYRVEEIDFQFDALKKHDEIYEESPYDYLLD